MTTRGGRENQAGRSLSLGAKDPRNRRQPQSGTTGNDLAAPLYIDVDGRIKIDLGDAFFIGPDGRMSLRVEHGLQIAAGSPLAVQVRLGREGSIQLDRQDALIARPNSDQVRNMSSVDGDTVSDALDALSTSTGTGVDVSYKEPLVADSYITDEAPLVYNEDGTDLVMSELRFD